MVRGVAMWLMFPCFVDPLPGARQDRRPNDGADTLVYVMGEMDRHA